MKINFKKLTASMVVAFALTSVTSYAQDKSSTITGEVLDMACYMKSGAHGDGHKDCAAMCVKGGSPMGILTSDNKVYLLVENHDKADAYAEAKKHAGEQVTVTGTVSARNGMNAIIADDVKGKM